LLVLTTLKEFQLVTLNVFFPLFTFCSAHISALVIVLADIPCQRIGKWEICLVLKEDKSLKHLAGTSMTKTVTYKVYRERQFLTLWRHRIMD
jgi:hypothetical protein